MRAKIVRENETIIDSAIKSCVFTEKVNGDVDLRPGCVASASIEVEVYGAQEEAPAAGEALTYYQVQDETETLIGTFYAEPSVPSRNTYAFTAYDAVSKLDADFSARLAEMQDSFPMTMTALLEAVEDVSGEKLAGTNMLADTNAPTLTKVSAGADRYWSNAGSLSENGEGTEWTAIADSPVSGVGYGAKFVCTAEGGNNHLASFYSSSIVPLITGEVYTLSMWAKGPAGATVRGDVLNPTAGSAETWITPQNITIDTADTWKQYSFTFLYNGEDDGARVYLGYSYNLVGTVWCCAFQLERGAKATGWRMSPDEITVNAFYADGLTCRNIVSYAAEILCKYVHCDAEGNVLFDWYADADNAIDPGDGGGIAYCQNGLDYANYDTAGLARVAVHPGVSEDMAYIYPDVAGGNTLNIQGNLLLTDADADTYTAVAKSIYNAMHDTGEYRPSTVKLFPFENPFRAGDIVSVTDIQGVTFRTLVMGMTTSANGASIESTGNEEYSDYESNPAKQIVNLAAWAGQAETKITKTNEAIILEATRAQNAETQLSSRITQTAESITQTVETAVNNLNVGGANLIINTKTPDVSAAAKYPRLRGQTSNTTLGGGTVTTAEHGVRTTSSADSVRPLVRFGVSGTGDNVSLNGLTVGETYTLSFDAAWKMATNAPESSSNSVTMRVFFYTGETQTGTYALTDSYTFATMERAQYGTDMTGRCEYTFTVPETATKLYLLIGCNFTPASYYGAGDYLELANLQLQVGNKATAWSPAVEDTTAEITDVRSTVTQQANKIALVVDGSNNIKAAEIVAAVNDSGSTVKIAADHIILDGQTVIDILETNDVTAKNLTIIDDDGNVIAQFRDTIVIGNDDSGHLEIDFNSMNLYDRDGNMFLSMGDTRDENGYTELTEDFNANGLSTTYEVQLNISSIKSLSVSGIPLGEGEYSYSGNTITFATRPSQYASIEVVYVSDQACYHYDIGNRKADTNYGLYSIANGLRGEASAAFTTVSGGVDNLASASRATVSGGDSNFAHGQGSSIGGGEGNAINTGGLDSAIAGGSGNYISGADAFIGGGIGNTVLSSSAVICGGSNNSATMPGAVVSGGQSNEASGTYSAIPGGRFLVANHRSQHVIGEFNEADGSSAGSDARGDYVEIVGNGTSVSNRSNARTLDWNGNEVLAGRITAAGRDVLAEIDSALGANLLPSVYNREGASGNPYTNNGITWTVNPDGSVTANGTATASSGFQLSGGTLTGGIPCVTLDPNKRYTVSGCPSGGGSSTYRIRARFTKEGTTPTTSSGTLIDDTGSGVTTTTAYKYAYVYCWIASGYTANNLTFYPMLEAGETAHSYVSSHDASYSYSTNAAVTVTSGTADTARVFRSGMTAELNLITTGTPVTTDWATIATIPAGYRPGSYNRVYTGLAGSSPIQCRITPSGNVDIKGFTASASATVWASFTYVI